MIKLSFLILTFLLVAKAHNHQKPVDPSAGIDQISSPNHAGYGYAGRSSEAEADRAIEFECDKKSTSQYLKSCSTSTTGADVQGMSDIVKKLESEKTLQSLRNQVFEYLTLQAAASKLERPVPITKPGCVEETKFNIRNKMSPKAPELDSLTKLKDKIQQEQEPSRKKDLQNQFDIDYKQFVVNNSFDAENIMNAVALFRQLENAKNVYECKPDGTQSMNCLDLSDQINRIKNAYPIIFSGPDSYSRIRKIENSAQQLLGAQLESSNSKKSIDLIKKNGASVWNARVYSTDWDAMQEIKKELETATNEAKEGSVELDSQGNITMSRKPLVDSAFKDLLKTNEELKDDFFKRISTDLTSMCLLDLSALSSKYPHVLRQMILDQPKENLPGIKLTLCSTEGVRNKLMGALDRSCSGVSGSLNAGNQMVSIDRSLPCFPFSAKQKYNVLKNADGSLTVNLNVYFQPKGKPAISEEELKLKMNAFSQSANKFYNESIQEFKPELDPKVKFKVNVNKGQGEPNFAFSSCYNRSLPPEQMYDCKKVESSGGNWQDSGHLTYDTDQETVNHEFSHILGLDDEYLQDYYPMNKLGEHDSIMNAGDRLYPRHVKSIINVALRCSK